MQHAKTFVALERTTILKNRNMLISHISPLTTQRGVSLIALIVTIAILIILAGVTINVAFGKNGILKSSEEFSNKVQETQEQKNQELNSLLEELENTMNEEGELQVATNITWSNEKATLKLTATIPGYTIYYKLSSSEYTQYTEPITNLVHADTVEVKLTKQNKPDKTLTVNIIDSGLPLATISLSATSTNVGETITATVTQTDNESGVSIASCKYIYNTTATQIGTTSSAWNTATAFSSNTQTVNLTASEPGTYYLHVLTVDKAENRTETLSQAVTIEEQRSTLENLIETAATNNETVYDKYGNKIRIPAGFKILPHGTGSENYIVEYTYDKEGGVSTNTPVVQDGIVIQNATDGNEFVWVPIGEIKNDAVANTTNKTTIILGRYEEFAVPYVTKPSPVQIASKTAYDVPIPAAYGTGSYIYDFIEISSDFAGGTFGNTTYSAASGYENTKALNLQEWISTSLDNGGYYIARYEASKNGTKAVSKAAKDTWCSITQPNAAIASKAMYPYSTEAKYYSDLINSYAWDTAVIFIETYSDVSYATKDGRSIKSSKSYTGSNADKRCNIQDMAGNVFELTTETCTRSNGGYPVTERGGSYNSSSGGVEQRSGNTKSVTNTMGSFRCTLCVK